MLFEHRYAGSSGVTQGDAATSMSFAPDTLREPTFFKGNVTKQVEFREAISALHDVVTSDLRFIPKDRTSYFAWREQQSYVDLAQVTANQKQVSDEINRLQAELGELEKRSANRGAGFYAARQKYFNYLYERDKELWFKLDPVITVHPDQVFFECFSKDESSYGRLAASYEVFEELGDRACGTTNIDYSEKLYNEFQKIRSYKTTTLDVDPGGFNVQTTMEDTYREVKIDLPDTWVRGFLQVSSAATLPARVVELHPMDVHNLCFVLRRNKELFGPRSLRFHLTPGAPVSVTVDPWGTKIDCPRSRYLDSGGAADVGEIRIWGRRRLFILERLLPRAKKVRLFLLGTGLPTFWVVDLGDLSFTLGLSGWTNNNWSEAGNFDLMAAREEVDNVTQLRVFDELGKSWFATPEQLAQRTGLDTPIVASALAGWVQAGRAIYDLDRAVYRKRELTRTPLPMEKLRFANEREEAAARLLHQARIAIDRADVVDGGLRLEGRIRMDGKMEAHRTERPHKQDGRNGKMYAPEMTFDAERRLVAGECSCDYYIRNKLHRGPCEHMLALRAAHRRGINDTISFESGTRREATADRESFQAAFRKSVMRAAELRSAGRLADSIHELERIAKLAPPDSDEFGRLQEVIAESKYDANEHAAARDAAERALKKFPNSVLALRVKRDALVRLDEIPHAIPVARALAGAENTPERWDELVRLCHRIEDYKAMLAFAEEGLRLHPKASRLTAARELAREHAPTTAPAPSPTESEPPAAEETAGKQSWWRRAVNKITGKGPNIAAGVAAAVDSLDARLGAIVDELERRGDVTDRRSLLHTLRVAHAGASTVEGQVQAMLAAMRTSNLIVIGSENEVAALLRRHLS